MDTAFPFGFPFATGFYLTAYVVTLAIHVVFMNYVLAGTGYLALAGIGHASWGEDPGGMNISGVLRDWLPFGLGAAITAGVAPLLFVQILYQQSFYTANLLLFHRWMSVLPVLIVGFYLLYLLKSERVLGWPRAARAAVSFSALACLAFTGYSWSENHVLSQHREVWASLYESGALFYRSGEILPRIGVWFSGSLATMLTIVSWQLWYYQRGGRSAAPGTPRRAALLAIAGIVLSAVCGCLYFGLADAGRRGALSGGLARPYLILAIVGLAIQLAAWIGQARADGFQAKWLWTATLGVVLSILGATIVREAVRLSAIDIAALYERHERAAAVGGLPVFLVCFVVNAGLIAWCLVLSHRRVASA